MKKIITLILLLVPFVVVLGQEDRLEADDYISESLMMLKITPEDCQLNSSTKNAFRLPVVDSLFENPLRTKNYLSSLTRSFSHEDINLSGKMKIALKQLGLKACEFSVDDISGINDKSHLPVQITEVINLALSLVPSIIEKYDSAISGLNPQEIALLKSKTLEDYWPKSANDDKTIWQIDAAEKASLAENEKYWQIAQKVNRQKIGEGAYIAMNLADFIDSLLKSFIKEDKHLYGYEYCEKATGDILFYQASEIGDIIVGGFGETIYNGQFALIIDIGGNDKYYCNAGGADTSLAASYCFDIAGDDLYISDKNCNFGAGFLGSGILIDYEGNDKYLAKNYTLGCGNFGLGLLWDKNGDDLYSTTQNSLASATMGFGLLIDGDGNDTYQGSLCCQGFASVGGLSYLLDLNGNDFYMTHSKFTDKLRYEDHSLSMSQGFSIGEPSNCSGGFAILNDVKGNDVYTSDIFGQGAACWSAVGALIDQEGDDTYFSHRYAQGAGIHSAIGTLIDGEGDDIYTSYSVSQGCGHDLGFGYLFDGQGNDNYSAVELSQGTGNANGIGLLFDYQGDDGYVVRKVEDSQGYGQAFREYGSIGLLIDVYGKDFYSGEKGSIQFYTKGNWGVKADFDEEED